MNRGYIRATKELMNDRNWPDIEFELKKVFTEVHREEKANGVFELHGYSEHFTHKPNEGASIEYCAIFTTKDNKPEFLRFETYHEALKHKDFS
jgi:hypothetical protein